MKYKIKMSYVLTFMAMTKGRGLLSGTLLIASDIVLMAHNPSWAMAMSVCLLSIEVSNWRCSTLDIHLGNFYSISDAPYCFDTHINLVKYFRSMQIQIINILLITNNK